MKRARCHSGSQSKSEGGNISICFPFPKAPGERWWIVLPWSLACLLKIEQLFYSHFHTVDSFFLEQGIQYATLVIVEMIMTGYQIPSDSADKGWTILHHDFRKRRFRITFINQFNVLSVTINRANWCIHAEEDRDSSSDGGYSSFLRLKSYTPSESVFRGLIIISHLYEISLIASWSLCPWRSSLWREICSLLTTAVQLKARLYSSSGRIQNGHRSRSSHIALEGAFCTPLRSLLGPLQQPP